MIRRTLAIAAGAVACLCPAASTAVAATPTTKHPSKLSGSFSMAMNLALKPGFDALHARFKKLYPNVEMTPTYMSVGGSSPFYSVVSTQIAGGNPPDVMWLLPGNGRPTSALILGPRGQVIDQSKQPWVKSMYKPIVNDYKTGNKIWGNEFALSMMSGITYNKTIFAKQKVKVPKTWSQFMRLCRVLSSKGITPISWGGATSAVNANNVWSLIYNNVFSKDPKWYDKRLKNRVTFSNTAGVRRSLNQVVEAQKNGCFRKGFESGTFADQGTEFGSGRAAMLWTTPILLGDILKANPNFKFGMFPPPGVKASDTRLVIQGQGGMGISSKTSGSTRAAAQAWVNYVYGEKQSRLISRVNFLISAQDARAGKLPAPYRDLKPYFDQDKVFATISIYYPNTGYTDTMGNAIQGLFTGQKTVDQVLSDMDKGFVKK